MPKVMPLIVSIHLWAPRSTHRVIHRYARSSFYSPSCAAYLFELTLDNNYLLIEVFFEFFGQFLSLDASIIIFSKEY